MSEKKEDSAPFEVDLKRLEEIVAKLENGGIKLEESLKLFEEGQILLKRCRTRLEEASVKVSKLLDDGSTQDIDPATLGR
ncbi:exodeoxyribonuclease VII small subunit [bacterium]|nr:exodeoxyribonuclease VII small subunit [bacterium]